MTEYEQRSQAFREMLDKEMPKINPKDVIMSKFKITIEEHISQVFEVEATDIEQAMEIAEQKYNEGEFVVDNCNAPTAKLMQVESEDGAECTEWVEF